MNSKIIEFSMVTVWDWFIQLLALFIIIWVLKTLLFKPVTEFIAKRQQLIAGELAEATSQKTNAEALRKEYEGKLTDINEEANGILKEARQKALKREEEIIAEAKAEAVAIKEKAMQDIALEEARVREEMKQEMIEVAGMMASKFVETSMDEQKQTQLIDQMIKEMGDVQWLS